MHPHRRTSPERSTGCRYFTKCVHIFFRQRSIALSVWLALSLLATAVTVPALGGYVWLAIRDDVARAHNQTNSAVAAIMATVQHFRAEGTVPSEEQLLLADGLGLEFIQILSGDGQHIGALVPNVRALQGYPVNQEMLDLLNSGMPASQTVRINGGSYRTESASAWNVLRGGHYGQEYTFPLVLGPNQQDSVRILIRYPDLAADAQRLLLRAIIAAVMVIGTTVIMMWLLLRLSITQPLRRYSDLASRIALGEQVRMPASGNDELSELGRAVNGMADALRYQATVDSLTGLFNLRHLSSTLESLLAESALSSEPLSLIVGDLDNLKPVNDTHGHPAGDRVLQAVGGAIMAWAGDKSVCWRLGGDEFVVALPDTTEAEATVLAQGLKDTVDSLHISFDGLDLRTSISVGVSFYPGDGDSAGALLGSADRRMYQAKSMNQPERKLADSAAA